MENKGEFPQMLRSLTRERVSTNSTPAGRRRGHIRQTTHEHQNHGERKQNLAVSVTTRAPNNHCSSFEHEAVVERVTPTVQNNVVCSTKRLMQDMYPLSDQAKMNTENILKPTLIESKFVYSSDGTVTRQVTPRHEGARLSREHVSVVKPRICTEYRK